MKMILRITMILLIASLVAGGFYLAVNNSFIVSSADEGHQPPATTSAEGQTFQPMERSEGGDNEIESITQGLSGVLVTLTKLAGITLLVLLLQKASSQLGGLKRKLA